MLLLPLLSLVTSVLVLLGKVPHSELVQLSTSTNIVKRGVACYGIHATASLMTCQRLNYLFMEVNPSPQLLNFKNLKPTTFLI